MTPFFLVGTRPEARLLVVYTYLFCLGVVLCSQSVVKSTAWTSFVPLAKVSRFRTATSAQRTLAKLNDNNNDNHQNDGSIPSSLSFIRRLTFAGVSVSPEGFWVILQVPQEGYWPIQVTCDAQDATAATSAESLLFIQLLNGVDMATPILPPELLSQLMILYAEQEQVSDILDLVELPRNVRSYASTTPWQRPRVALPKVTLDQVVLRCDDGMDRSSSGGNRNTPAASFVLECTGPETGSFSFAPVRLDEVHGNDDNTSYHPTTTCAFVSLALALRYRAPLIMTLLSSLEKEETELFLSSEDHVRAQFPMYTSVDNLRQSSERVHSNIARGFEIHKLTGALRIAMERGDEAAVRRIRETLDEYDSMEELPTLGDQGSDDDNAGMDDTDPILQ